MGKIDVSTLANMQMDCACGRTHKVPIKNIFTGTGAIDKLPEILEDFSGKKVFFIGDENTMPMAEAKMLDMLAAKNCTVVPYTFKSKTHLILDEPLIGSMLIRMPSDTDFILTLGSGTLNDLSRVISSRCKIPYIIVGTAPSMDGYASSVSPVVMDGGKHSVQLCVPYAIVTDTDLMKTAPEEMLSSGVGDILGKYVALWDWKLAQQETGEYFCEYIADMINDAVKRCVDGISQIGNRNPQVITDMAETLVMSGVAISMHGVSRPASGCEHQLAHYWEVALIKPDTNTPLHGNFVGLGTEIACRMYQIAGEEFGIKFDYPLPSPSEISDYMRSLGSYSSIETLGVTKEMFYDSFFHATAANGRYTLISYLEEKGRLEAYAKQITEEFFAK